MIKGLDSLGGLQELYLSFNGISRIEGVQCLVRPFHFGCRPFIFQRDSLKILDVAYNCIEKVENVSILEKLEEFWANNNLIGSFRDLENLCLCKDTLKTVYFDKNPISADLSYRRKIKLLFPGVSQIDSTPSSAHIVNK